jgi:hypothetical protein
MTIVPTDLRWREQKRTCVTQRSAQACADLQPFRAQGVALRFTKLRALYGQPARCSSRAARSYKPTSSLPLMGRWIEAACGKHGGSDKNIIRIAETRTTTYSNAASTVLYDLIRFALNKRQS